MWAWPCARMVCCVFMHASAPRNYGKVVIDSRLSDYLNRYKSHAGIMVTRPMR